MIDQAKSHSELVLKAEFRGNLDDVHSSLVLVPTSREESHVSKPENTGPEPG